MTTTPKKKAAEKAVTQLEKAELGQPYDELVEVAAGAIEELADAGTPELFPPHLAPVSDAALRDFQIAVDLMGRDKDVQLFPLHAQALAGGNDELAAIIRSPRGLRLVDRAARARAVTLHNAELQRTADDRESRAAIARFQREIAGQLFNAGGELAKVAAVLAVDVPELEQRLEAVKQRHEEHQRVAAEKAAETEVQELVAFFEARRRRAVLKTRVDSFKVRVTDGETVAQRLFYHRTGENIVWARQLRELCEVRDFFEERATSPFHFGGKNYNGSAIANNLTANPSPENVARWRKNRDEYAAETEQATA